MQLFLSLLMWRSDCCLWLSRPDIGHREEHSVICYVKAFRQPLPHSFLSLPASLSHQ